jgi:excinuclease UvrABC helicase subunit UvrB
LWIYIYIYTYMFFNRSLNLKQYFSLQTRKTASWLAAELSKEGHQVALLSGEMMVEQRAAVIERFREGKEKVLVTTNVCARGEQRLSWCARLRILAMLAREFLISMVSGLGRDISLQQRLDFPSDGN